MIDAYVVTYAYTESGIRSYKSYLTDGPDTETHFAITILTEHDLSNTLTDLRTANTTVIARDGGHLHGRSCWTFCYRHVLREGFMRISGREFENRIIVERYERAHF